MLNDNLDDVFGEFYKRRTADLYHRFNGWYRAIVEDTNDPLIMRRVRVRIPELHDFDVPVQDLPWAMPASWMGGRNAGSWTSCIKGDEVFIAFEKNHPYAPVYTAAADSTRRRMYSLWSVYGRTPLAVNTEGKPAEQPDDFIKEFLPKDGRPMSNGFSDRYGNVFQFNSTGFFPSAHRIKPTAVGTDAISKTSYNLSQAVPEEDAPDTKYALLASKYGHFALLGDQGYKWSAEFEGDFEKDQEFEVARYKYMLRMLNEQEASGRDQRRFEFRTRAGHQFEMRDVGWVESRPGEYLDERKKIADSQGRDERWIKIRSKGGHLFQVLDRGADPKSDNFYKRLNKSEFGSSHDQEDDLGEDARMMRMISRHGNMLVLDDRGCSPTAGENATPHGNGFLLRSRKGFQIQGVDKPELDHFMVVSPKNQCFEINDRFQYMLMSTAQAGDLHTKLESTQVRGRPPYITKTGQSNDPASNTHHLILDKLNDMVRLKNPDGAGMEVRGQKAPCGKWVETRDSDDRAMWMSSTDKMILIRDGEGTKYIWIDDNDNVVVLRNELGKIQIHAQGNVEIKSAGKVCIDADEIGLRARSRIAVEAGGNLSVFDSRGFFTLKDLGAKKVRATVDQPSPDGAKPCKVEVAVPTRVKPDDFDKERGCDDFKPQKGPIPAGILDSPPGGGTGGGASPPVPPGDSRGEPPAPSETAPRDPGAVVPPAPDPQPDPIESLSGTGVLWYGTSTRFLEEIESFGLTLSSLANHLNVPSQINAIEYQLSKTLEFASSKQQAILAQMRYGGSALILRIRNVPNAELLAPFNNDLVSYRGDIEFNGNIEVYEVGTTELTTPPLFQI